MITLYGFGRGHRKVIGETRDLRVQWALEELGLPYRVHPLDHTGGELDSPAYAAISPFNQVPVIDDDGVVVAETGAILLYLAEKAGVLPADAAGRAAVVQWCFAALTTVGPWRARPGSGRSSATPSGSARPSRTSDDRQRFSTHRFATRARPGVEREVADLDDILSADARPLTAPDPAGATLWRTLARAGRQDGRTYGLRSRAGGGVRAAGGRGRSARRA